MLRQTTFEQFKAQVSRALESGKRVVTIVREILGDFITPLTAYRALSTSHGSALLESVGGADHQGRYSIVAISPYLKVSVKAGVLAAKYELLHCGDVGFMGVSEKLVSHKPLEVLRELMGYHSPEKTHPFFTGGAIGYMGHEAITLLEPTVPCHSADDLDVADVLLNFYRHVLVFDNATQGLYLICNQPVKDNEYVKQGSHDYLYQAAQKELDEIERKLERAKFDISEPSPVNALVTSRLTDSEFESMVLAAKEHISAGDVFQVVISRRFETPFVTNRSLDFYRLLRRVNPSPYMFHLDIGKPSFRLVGASPEVMASIHNGEILIRPLAGTKKRGASATEDDKLAKELAADTKEQAEHRMLVDLARNDVGRVSKSGSVVVEGLMRVEPYGNLLHMVTDVRGKLKDGISGFEAALSCLPAGTLSGAPKIRALQLIAELEPSQRGLYGGAVGWFTDTDLDVCIAIRSATISGGMLYFQAGAGIVADSIPASEREEIDAKTGSIRAALAMLGEGKI